MASTSIMNKGAPSATPTVPQWAGLELSITAWCIASALATYDEQPTKHYRAEFSHGLGRELVCVYLLR